jgi:3'-phosphoadenosine 5'-phosphosulfate sulfotransferase (PAPS reductase)/FAD synthetase
MKRRIYHIGISGGKDSTALLLWMAHESRIPHKWMVASFCDTENEAPETYEHIKMLNDRIFPVHTIKTEGFIQLAKRKQRFPSTKARFCTQELKLVPTARFLHEVLTRCKELIAVSGVRRDESEDRKDLSEWGDPLDSYFGLREWRPLIDWRIEDVLMIHARYRVPLNPLYAIGARRVGCFPCIHSSKSEIRGMITHKPERIAQIRDWELEVGELSARRSATFFPPNKVPESFRSKEALNKKGQLKRFCTIDDVVRWAQTGWRAQGQAPDVEGLFDEQLKDLPPSLCLTQYSACE